MFEPSGPAEWEVFLRLAGVLAGQGPNADGAALDDLVISTLVQREVGDPGSRVAGRDPAELIEALEPRRGPERVLDFMLRVGPYGDGFGAEPEGLTLDVLERNPHGVDLGPHRERVPEVLRTPSGRIELAPEAIVADVERLQGALARELQRRPGADRPAPAALEQLVDAQPAGAREGQGPLHAARAPRRRRAARPRGRRPRGGQLGGGSDRGAGRGDRRHHARASCRSRTAGATTRPG